MHTVTDQELAARTLRGDKLAFGILVERYQGSIFSVGYRMHGNAKLAEDMSQETFIRAYQRIESYDPSRTFGPWIRRIAVNLSLNLLAKKRFEQLPFEEFSEIIIQKPGRETEQKVLMDESSQELHQAILQLPSAQIAVIEMHHFQHMSYAEIADQLKMPINTVKSHLYRARKYLAKILRNNSDEE